MARTFIGWSPPEALRDEIREITGILRESLPRASWVRPDTVHVTFAFLGEQTEDSVGRLGGSLAAAMSATAPASVSIRTPGFFPSPRRPRVGWLGLTDPGGLETIARATRRVLVREEIEFDEKPFRPHLTLVRPKHRWSRGDVDQFLSAWRSLEGYPLLVDSVILFESQLHPHGARHIPRVVAPCSSE